MLIYAGQKPKDVFTLVLLESQTKILALNLRRNLTTEESIIRLGYLFIPPVCQVLFRYDNCHYGRYLYFGPQNRTCSVSWPLRVLQLKHP